MRVQVPFATCVFFFSLSSLKKNITDVRAKCLKSVTNKIHFKKDE